VRNNIYKNVLSELSPDEIKRSPKYDPSQPVTQNNEGKRNNQYQKPEFKEWVLFKFHAAPRSKVYIAGDFNNWDPTALKLGYHGKGVYSAIVLLPLGTYEYKFTVNGEWCNGQDCNDQVTNAFGTMNNRLIVERKMTHNGHPHTFSRLPESESHRLWSAPTGG